MKSNKIIRKGLKSYFPAFTLVELIVVIVILAILATIAFLSFNSYSAWARDSKRMSNIALIAKWFEMNIAQWKAIVTSETSSIPNLVLSGTEIMHGWPFSWWLIKYPGYYDSPIWQKLLKSIWIWWWDINLKADEFQNYRYSYVPLVQKYQVSWMLENPYSVSFYDNINNINLDFSDLYNSTFADSSTWWYVFLKWNYIWTWWVEWLIPIQTVWEATTVSTGWVRIIAWTDTLVISTWWVTAPEIPSTLPTCKFDATDDSWKFDKCSFGL